jgi:hypothetical protein
MILLEISALAAGCRLLELALELGLLLLAPSVAVFPLAFTHVVHKRGCRGGREGGREGGGWEGVSRVRVRPEYRH